MAKATSKPGIHGFLAGLGVGAGLTVATGVGLVVPPPPLLPSLPPL